MRENTQLNHEEIKLAVENFGEFIMQVKERKKWTFEEFAHRVGSTPSYLYRIGKKERCATLNFQVQMLSKFEWWSEKDILQFLALYLDKNNIEVEK